MSEPGATLEAGRRTGWDRSRERPRREGLPGSPAAEALARVLAEAAAVVAGLPPCHYTRRPVEGFEASVGEHVRHALDHVEALARGAATGRIDYDDRRRGTNVERSPAAALAAIDRLGRSILALAASWRDRPVIVRDRLDAGADPVEIPSTFGREMVFVVSHTTHHNAMIAAMMKRLGHEVDPGFGEAPSTAAWRERACAR